MNWNAAITSIITLLVGVFGSTGFWAYWSARREKKSEIYKKMDEIENHVNHHIKCMQSAVRGLTYVNIVKTCEYWIERGWVEQDDIRDLEHYLYDPYRAWGGNGTAERLFNQVCMLPNKPPKED